MLTIKFEGLEEAMKWMSDIEKKQLPFATALALTRTAKDVAAKEKEEMASVFDRPTKYTLNSLQVTPAKKQKLEALVWFKNPPRLGDKEHYLVPQVFGGSRPLKRFEKMLGNRYLMPGAGAPLDRYGNIKPSFLVQLLSSLGRISERGFAMNRTAKSAKGGAMRDFFLLQEQRGGLAPGVYRRVARAGTNFKGAGKGAFAFQKGAARGGRQHSVIRARGVMPVLVAGKPPNYSQLFKFFEVAEKVASERLDSNFAKAFEDAMRTAK